MAKVIIQSADWKEMINLGWLGDNPTTDDAEWLLEQAETFIWNDYSCTPYGECECLLRDRGCVVGVIDYLFMPEAEDIKELADAGEWELLKEAANAMIEFEGVEQDTTSLLEEIRNVIKGE